MSMLRRQIVGTVLASLLAHWGYFNRGEHDLQAPLIARAHLALALVIFVAKIFIERLTMQTAVYQTWVLAATYFVVMMASIAAYRMFFSPIKQFPGLLSWKLSKLSHVWSMSRPDNYLVLEKQHRKYGDYVRTGPNEVTLFTAEAYQQVYGAGSECSKGAYYDILQPMESLDTTRDPAIHTKRRKVWDQFFSIRSLEKQESTIYHYANRLVEAIGNRLDKPLNASDWFEYYTFDAMGKFGLGVDFCLLSGRPHIIQTLYHGSHPAIGQMGVAPWIMHLCMSIPGIKRFKYYQLYLGWAKECLERKVAILQNKAEPDSDFDDVLTYIVDDALKKKTVESEWRFLMGDLSLLVAAGSDPMCYTIANIFFYLITKPTYFQQLRDELGRTDIQNYRALSQAKLLTAIIYETLRLHPAVPSACLRITPPQGLRLSDAFIPGGITVLVPQYSVLRDKRCFVMPNDFIPERFTSRPDLILNHEAFTPWSTGKSSCIGKNLALLEIRVALALLVDRFDVDFAFGEDGSRLFAESIDYFTVRPGPLKLVFNERKA